MNNKEIMKLTPIELDDELFREIENSWDTKMLIRYVIDSLSLEEKRRWIKNWFEV